MEFMGQYQEEAKRIDLDVVDRKILYLLSVNGRFSESSIAKSLKTSKEVVHYRLKRMQQEGFLHGFMTLLDHQKLGYVVHDISVSLHPSSDFERIIKTLLAHPHVTHVKQCSAPFDLQFRIMTTSIPEFVAIVDQLLNEYYMYVRDYAISTILEEHFLGLHFLVDKEDIPIITERKGPSFHKEFEQKKAEQKKAAPSLVLNKILDEQDKEILRALTLHARIPVLALSHQMKLATTSVHNRLQALVKSGIIKQFLPYASFSFLGYQWYLLRLRTKNLPQQKFRHYLKQHPNLVWMSQHVGKWNYHLSIFARNNTELNQVVQNIRNNFLDSIIAYESEMVFKQYKFTSLIL